MGVKVKIELSLTRAQFSGSGAQQNRYFFNTFSIAFLGAPPEPLLYWFGPLRGEGDYWRGPENSLEIRSQNWCKWGPPGLPKIAQKLKTSFKKGSQNIGMFPEGSPRGPRDAPGPLFERFWKVLRVQNAAKNCPKSSKIGSNKPQRKVVKMRWKNKVSRWSGT